MNANITSVALENPTVAVLSDIHGNYESLTYVHKVLKKKKITQILFLGDLVGYFYEPEKCLSLLKQFKLYSVEGNHEKMYKDLKLNKIDEDFVLKKYGSAIFRTLAKSDTELDDFISSLPLTMDLHYEDTSVKIAHGNLQNSNAYVYQDSPELVRGSLDHLGFNYLFLGNTHRQMIYLGNYTTIINPGSVGMPRSRKGIIQFTICNLATTEFTFYNSNIFPSQTKAQVKLWDPNNHILNSYFE